MINQRLKIGRSQTLFCIGLIYPGRSLYEIFPDQFVQAKRDPRQRGYPGRAFHQSEGSKDILNVLLEVLKENAPFSFYKEMETLLRSVDFKKAVDDQDDKKDPGKDGEIDRRKTSFCPATLSEQYTPRPYSSLDLSWGGIFLGFIGPFRSGLCIILRKKGISNSGHQLLSCSGVRAPLIFTR